MVWIIQEKLQVIEKEDDYYPVLTLPEGTHCFMEYFDTSSVGLCCVLMKNVKVITYASR